MNNSWQEILWSRIKLSPGDGCWEWLGCVNKKGYGIARKDGRTHLVHRLAWESAKREIPQGYNILHACDNRRCCRLDHLSTGTQSENVADMDRKGRRRNPQGEAHGRSKLKEEDIIAIRNRYMGGETYASINSDYPYIGMTTIQRTITKKTWKYIK